MKKSTKKVLTAMVALLIVLVIVIIILAVTDHQSVSEEDLGTTVIGEQAAAEVEETESETETETEPTSVDLENEKEVALYLLSGGVATKVTSYDSTWSILEDINTFEAFNTDVDSFTYDNYYTVHEDYWNQVETDTEYKIGYQLSFDVDGQTHVITILEPADITNSTDLYNGDYTYDEAGDVNNAEDITGYLGVWLYDDTGHDSWYEHLTQDEVTADTLLTSIKLRPTPQSDQISNLTLTAFSYSSEEEFNSAGQYIGTHGYTISVNNQ